MTHKRETHTSARDLCAHALTYTREKVIAGTKFPEAIAALAFTGIQRGNEYNSGVKRAQETLRAACARMRTSANARVARKRAHLHARKFVAAQLKPWRIRQIPSGRRIYTVSELAAAIRENRVNRLVESRLKATLSLGYKNSKIEIAETATARRVSWWSLSTMPILTCPARVPCARPDACYSVPGILGLHGKTICVNRVRNTCAMRANVWLAMLALYCTLCRKSESQSDFQPIFRFFVDGDCEKSWWAALAELVRALPTIKFVQYTKEYRGAARVAGAGMPDNWHLRLSAWPGYALYNPHGLPVAWVLKKSETRAAARAKSVHVCDCTRPCAACKLCANSSVSVAFPFHNPTDAEGRENIAKRHKK